MKPFGSTLLSAVTSASLLMHAVLGCCGHHGHAEAAEEPASLAARVASLPASVAGVVASHQAPCSGCESASWGCARRCHFTRPGVVRVLAPPQWDGWRLTAFLPMLSPERPRSMWRTEGELPTPHSFGALRLHLAHRVLLT